MELCHWEPLREFRRCQTSIPGWSNQRVGRTDAMACRGTWECWQQLCRDIGSPVTTSGAPQNANDRPGSILNWSKAVWDKWHNLWECCWCAWEAMLLLVGSPSYWTRTNPNPTPVLTCKHATLLAIWSQIFMANYVHQFYSKLIEYRVKLQLTMRRSYPINEKLNPEWYMQMIKKNVMAAPTLELVWVLKREIAEIMKESMQTKQNLKDIRVEYEKEPRLGNQVWKILLPFTEWQWDIVVGNFVISQVISSIMIFSNYLRCMTFISATAVTFTNVWYYWILQLIKV